MSESPVSDGVAQRVSALLFHDDEGSDAHARLTQSRRWVIKLGSALLTADGAGLDRALLRTMVAQLVALRESGCQLVVVSSGAVAEGMARMGWERRPAMLPQLQAAAAIGQMGLAQAWESAFSQFGLQTAQILLTHDDLSDRRRYLNARATLLALVEHGAVPVINENDTVTTEEIRFGDNDTLAALVANLFEADTLLLLTDQAGLYEEDPRSHPGARVVRVAHAQDARLDAMAGETGGMLGRGGMFTKLRAARLAARSGASTVIAPGRLERVVELLAQGRVIGSLLLPDTDRWVARKQWLGSQLNTRGRLYLDEGAARALVREGRSLLAVGVRGSEGRFRRGDIVSCLAPDGKEVARGLVNYSAAEIARVCGLGSDQILRVLGYMQEPELIHRDNLVVLAKLPAGTDCSWTGSDEPGRDR